MGWLRPSGSPAAHLHKVAGNVEVDRNHSPQSPDRKPTEHADDKSESKKSYPTQPKRTADKDLPLIAADDVKTQDGKDGKNLLIVVDDIVLDCTSYVSKHPGGRQIITGFGGQNCGWQWWAFHNRKVWNDVAVNLRVGRTEKIENKFVKPPAFVGLRPFGYQDD